MWQQYCLAFEANPFVDVIYFYYNDVIHYTDEENDYVASRGLDICPHVFDEVPCHGTQSRRVPPPTLASKNGC
jgi:hypothetical protein